MKRCSSWSGSRDHSWGGEPILEGNREEVRPKREMGGGGTKE